MSNKPRILPPEKGNPYYIYKGDGGYNPARGNPARRNKNLTSLPNCVSIYGWFNEVGGQGQKYLTKAWYPYSVIAAAKREGLTVTKEPTIGGIMVWTGGKHGDGHVEGCGDKFDDDLILGVGSEYYGEDWVAFKRKRGDGNWRGGCPWMDSSYIYQGCIKNPFMEEDMTKAETEALIRSMVPGIVADEVREIEKAKAEESPSTWTVLEDGTDIIEEVKKAGIMVGDKGGNFRPLSDVTREELAAVAYALYKMFTS